jgi:cytoskeleton protein RodZ
MRNYARLLELPDDSIVTRVVSRSEPPPLVSTSASRKQASSHDWLTRLATLVIVGVIILSVVMWWMQRESVERQAVAPAPTIAEADENRNLKLSEAVPQAVAPAADESSAEEPVGESEPTQVPDVAAPEQAEPAAVSTTQQPEAAPAPAPLTDAMPQSKLELHFEADSWTEIEDSAGRRLSYGLVEAGKVLVLMGEAPFSVFLGYAPGVKVYYNGDLFDHSPFQRRDVARFRIGRAEHNHPGSR